MLLKARKKFLLAKTESTYGTDSVPTGGANAIETRNLTIEPLRAEVVQQAIDRGILGGEVGLHVGIHHALEFDVGFAASGTAGTAPGWGPLMKACGHSETIVASTSVTYAPIDASIESLSMRVHHDGELHNFVGCRGSVSLQLDTDGVPVWQFSMIGLYVAPSAVSDPTPDISAFVSPLPISQSETTFTLHSYTANGKSFSFDQQGAVEYLSLTDQESVEFTDRNASGSIVMALPEIGTKDFYAIAAANTLGAAQVVHGTTGGNIITFDSAQCQVLSPSLSDEKGISMLNLNLGFYPTAAGGNDYSWTLT
jgi:hypothetical protein